MKPLVIYHKDCADGFGAAFAAWHMLGDEAEYYADQYGKTDAPWRQDENLDTRDIYILDFSYPKEDMEYLFKCAKRVVWLDHHKTAFEMWCAAERNKFEYHAWLDGSEQFIVLDNNKSGALLAWEYFHRDSEIPMLIQHIDDYDRWQFKLEGTKAFHKALWSRVPWSFEQWQDTFLPCSNDDSVNELGQTSFGWVLYAAHIDDGSAILRAHDANVQAVVKGAVMKCVIPHADGEQFRPKNIGLAANCPPHLSSDVGHQLALKSGTYGLLWYINKEGKCMCGLRSNGDYDVSVIAKAFGGGGHKNAAGFEIDIQTLLGWIKA